MKHALIHRLALASLLAAALPAAPALAADAPPAFTPPAADAIPDNEFGKVVREESRSSCIPRSAPPSSSATT